MSRAERCTCGEPERIQLPSGTWVEKRHTTKGSPEYFRSGTHPDGGTWIVPVYGDLGSDLWTLAERSRPCAGSVDGTCALRCRPHWNCPECGPHVAVDEDGCCSTCGADAVPINAAGECDLCGAGIESGDGHDEGCQHYRRMRD